MHADQILEALGRQLREARQNRGFTQLELARLAGLPRTKIIQVEAGKPSVSIEAYAKVVAALGLSMDVTAATRPTLDDLDAAR
jgi:transcriptional regulator with XRE-family HTH domain